MVVAKEPKMGRFAVEVELTNYKDLIHSEAGHLPRQQVRRVRIRGVVDSGATRLVIPARVAKELGLEATGSATVHYADRRTAKRDMVENVYLAYGDRHGVFTAIVEPKRDSVLIGAIVIEDLDLIVDCANERLVPRDPKRIVSEIE